MSRLSRFARWFLAREDAPAAVGRAPERSNLYSLQERRALRVLEALTPAVCPFCGDRRPNHDTNCPRHAWSHRGMDGGDPA